ncbi:LolA family protein [Streptomyces paludis]|uniref:Outer membrane lipoprotein carrier protein LolA n=1 Tax=Streptomyces paludis TaxID=2282738 RepID=A0A345HNU8_9ACTN|nr:DUF2092 domain-containing protein [Streptomyces paludis]AXG78372.1 outer membrane lipoprotein carrier protein LolA [Streptomyces paludis]
MAANDSARITEEEDREPGVIRRKATRYGLPLAVAGVAAATIGLVPALAATTGGPDLADISAQRLIEKIAASDTQQLSGSVKISTDLGLPGLSGLDSLAGSLGAGSVTGGAASADPSEKLMELSSGTHTLRVAVDGPDKQRLSILENAAEYSLIHNGDEVWAYDSASNEAYHATAPKDGAKTTGKGATESQGRSLTATPADFAAEALKASADTTSVTVDGTTRIAGRDAYRLLVKPKQSGSTIGSVTIAVDAKTGTPLKFTLASSAGGKAIVDVGFTKVDFAKPAASTFDFTPPKGAKVTEGKDHDAATADGAKDPSSDDTPFNSGGIPDGLGGLVGLDAGAGDGGVKTIGKGWSTVFELTSGDSVRGGADRDSAKADDLPADTQGFINSLGEKVTGKFGSGTLYKTRIVNALMTDDGKVYVGAVTKESLLKAADQAK